MEVVKEHKRVLKNKIWMPVLKSSVPDIKPVISTWAMKLKASRTRRVRVNARGFKQIPHVHYNPDDKASPVVNMTTFRIILII